MEICLQPRGQIGPSAWRTHCEARKYCSRKPPDLDEGAPTREWPLRISFSRFVRQEGFSWSESQLLLPVSLSLALQSPVLFPEINIVKSAAASRDLYMVSSPCLWFGRLVRSERCLCYSATKARVYPIYGSRVATFSQRRRG